MDISSSLADWMINQLEMLPISFLRDRKQVPQRLFAQFMGEREAAELDTLLQQACSREDYSLTVLVPGIMGSLLSSIRGISAMLWINPSIFLGGQINLLELDESGARDKSPELQVTAVGLEKLYYLNLVISLANETHLLEFPYDWRYANQESAEQLYQALLRWSSGYPGQQFTLVGHSMGGIVIRTFLALYPAEALRLVERVILLASPLYGSPLAAAFLSGSAPNQDLGARLNPANDLVALASSFPSIYQLLPPPRDLFKPNRYYPADWDLYDAAEWRIPGVRQQHLDSALALYQLLDSSDPQVPIYQVAGAGFNTMTDIRREKHDRQYDFVPVYHAVDGLRGDDQVPLYSAWDDRLTTYFVNERHQRIPGNTAVRQAVLDLARGTKPGLPQVPKNEPATSGIATSDALKRQFNDFKQRFERGIFNRDDLTRLFWGASD